MTNRKSGILLHISSLPSEYGIGRLGKSARDFVDYIASCGISCWQLLPVSPTSFGDSPYQSFSIHAGNPYFIDFDTLREEGLLDTMDYRNFLWDFDNRHVSYELLYENNERVLRLAFERFNEANAEEFYAENAYWLDEYALFMALKDDNDGKPWYCWSEALKLHDEEATALARQELDAEIRFHKFVQFKFFEQWKALKQYANENGISLIGDAPIYAALDSVEVWSSPELFQLGADKLPTAVAGCPPDDFAPTGQLWGNPLYKWSYHKKTGFAWWLERIRFSLGLFDTLRIDHFRGFESYYAIPAGDPTAENGKWCKAPGRELFRAVRRELQNADIIAENLGFLTPEVERLLKESGYPGMKVLEFGFDNGKNGYLPHNCNSVNSVIYTGTHDNETLLGWAKGLPKANARFAKSYLGVEKRRDIPAALVRLAFSSVCALCIVPLQDFLELDNSARMNTPSTIGTNWLFRAIPQDFTPALKRRIKQLNELYNRMPDADEKTASEENSEVQ